MCLHDFYKMHLRLTLQEEIISEKMQQPSLLKQPIIAENKSYL